MPTPESVGPRRTNKDLSDISASEKPSARNGFFASVYGGTTASLDNPVRPAPTLDREDSVAPTPQQTPESNWSPSLQSVLDQPPASLPFRVMLGGMAFCMAFGAWSWFGQIEDVGHAQGQLAPQGEPYKIHPVVSGKVASIAVKEGDVVKAGQVLVELDSQIATNEVQRLEQERTSYRTQLSQTQALIEKTRLEAESHVTIADAKIQASQATIAQANSKAQAVGEAIALAKKKIDTTMEMLAQLRADANAYRVRRERLQPLSGKSQELQRQLQADVSASQTRQETLKPLNDESVKLRTQLEADLEAAKARVERLKPLATQGALPKERLYDLEQAVRERERAIIENRLQEVTRVKEQQFQAEQALRDRQRAIIQTQLQEDSSVKEQLFQAEQAIRNTERSITQTQGELQQAQAEVNRLQAELKQAYSEANRLQAEQTQLVAQKKTTQLEDQQKIQQLEVQKTQLQAKIDESEKLLARAKTELKQLAFTAPVDGVVSSLNIKNPGEVVQPGQTVAEVAPQDVPLVLIARLPNREAGFVKTGMSVKIKLDAYPYQDFGVVSGKVTSISPDAKPDERLGAVYRVEVALDRNFVTSNNQKIKFKPGQTAMADIVIRERRIIDVLLEPIKHMQKGGLNL